MQGRTKSRQAECFPASNVGGRRKNKTFLVHPYGYSLHKSRLISAHKCQKGSVVEENTRGYGRSPLYLPCQTRFSSLCPTSELVSPMSQNAGPRNETGQRRNEANELILLSEESQWSVKLTSQLERQQICVSFEFFSLFRSRRQKMSLVSLPFRFE